MSVAYSKTEKSITITVGFVPKTIPSTHPNYNEIVKLARDPATTEAQIAPLLDVGRTITEATSGNITVQGGQLFFKGYPVKSTLATTILQLLREGNEAGAEPLKLFLEKAFANPDPRAASDLFDWVVHSKLPITPDGDILAWKAVRDDYLSIHGGTRHPEFDHHIGNFVEQDRTKCDANPDRTCSTGLHFAAADYLPSYASGGSRIVAVKISPTDVVAFPTDYGWSKGRAWRYQIVGEVPLDQVPEFYPQGRRIYSGWSTPSVGQVWLNRKGEEVVISGIETEDRYPVQTDTGLFTSSGHYISDTEEHPLDLVKFVR